MTKNAKVEGKVMTGMTLEMKLKKLMEYKLLYQLPG